MLSAQPHDCPKGANSTGSLLITHIFADQRPCLLKSGLNLSCFPPLRNKAKTAWLRLQASLHPPGLCSESLSMPPAPQWAGPWKKPISSGQGAPSTRCLELRAPT